MLHSRGYFASAVDKPLVPFKHEPGLIKLAASAAPSNMNNVDKPLMPTFGSKVATHLLTKRIPFSRTKEKISLRGNMIKNT